MDDRRTDNRRQIGQTEFLYGDLTYKLIGLLYQINGLIGFGQAEKVCCNALAELLKEGSIPFQRELYCPIKLGDKVIAKRYFDFLVDEKIIIEVKVGDYKYKEACTQLFAYLKNSGIKLGIIV